MIGRHAFFIAYWETGLPSETKTRFANLLAEPVGNSPDEFASFMKNDLAKYEKVVKASGAKVD